MKCVMTDNNEGEIMHFAYLSQQQTYIPTSNTNLCLSVSVHKHYNL